MPLTPPVAAKTLSAEEKKEMVQADHFQVTFGVTRRKCFHVLVDRVIS